MIPNIVCCLILLFSVIGFFATLNFVYDNLGFISRIRYKYDEKRKDEEKRKRMIQIKNYFKQNNSMINNFVKTIQDPKYTYSYLEKLKETDFVGFLHIFKMYLLYRTYLWFNNQDIFDCNSHYEVCDTIIFKKHYISDINFYKNDEDKCYFIEYTLRNRNNDSFVDRTVIQLYDENCNICKTLDDYVKNERHNIEIKELYKKTFS